MYLNLNSFEENPKLQKNGIFFRVPNDLIYCIDSQKVNYLFIDLQKISMNNDCNNTCFSQTKKLIIDKKKCIDDCKNDDKYIYEYNNICYDTVQQESENDDSINTVTLSNINSVNLFINENTSKTEIIENGDSTENINSFEKTEIFVNIDSTEKIENIGKNENIENTENILMTEKQDNIRTEIIEKNDETDKSKIKEKTEFIEDKETIKEIEGSENHENIKNTEEYNENTENKEKKENADIPWEDYFLMVLLN